MEGLKPCPFCGGKAITVLLKPDGTPVMKEDIMKEKGE